MKYLEIVQSISLQLTGEYITPDEAFRKLIKRYGDKFLDDFKKEMVEKTKAKE